LPKIPLPVRDGLNPTRLVLPRGEAAQAYPTALSYLLARFPDDTARILEKVAAGEVVTGTGTAIDSATVLEPGGLLYLYRDPPADELDVPELADLQVLHRDENLLVVDKPHFVSVLPRGRWVQNTALVRLRRDLELPELSPAHRLDRLTAGVLVFTIRPEVRGAYQMLFERRQVRKEYLAVAPLPESDELDFPITVRSRIVKRRGTVAAMPEAGPPNAKSVIDLVARDEDRSLGLYRLTPHTGKTHQLRLHMATLGLPILGDPFADFWLPTTTPAVRVAPDQPAATPLQLLSQRLEFTDPLTGKQRRYSSTRALAAWQ